MSSHIKTVTILVLILLMTTVSFAQPSWMPLEPGTLEDLRCISSPFPDYAWASGNSGLIIHSNDGGETWFEQASNVINTLYGISFITESIGTAAGAGGAIVETDNGGWTWNVIQDGWMISYYAAQQMNWTTAFTAGEYSIMQCLITYTGDNWANMQSSNFYVHQSTTGYESKIMDVHFNNTNHGYAAVKVFNGQGAIAETVDGGQIWNTIYWSDQALLSIEFVSPDDGFAVGQNGRIVKTVNGGRDWQVLNAGITVNFNGVSMITGDHIWVAGNAGLILHTSDGGNSWEVQESGTPHNLTSIDMIDLEHGYAAGENGAVVKFGFEAMQGLEVTLDPMNPPIIIPEEGGFFDFNIMVTNNGILPQNFDVWTMIMLPSGMLYGPVINANVNLPAQASVERDRSQAVPVLAPSGQYTYFAYAGQYPWGELDEDFFLFEKAGHDSGVEGLEGWLTWGEDIAEDYTAAAPSEFKMHGAYPNPFNPAAKIAFDLPEEADVCLKVFDALGRQAAVLADGYLPAGKYELEFNGENFTSGVYFYRLTAGNYSASGKMLMIK
ncbi:MAG: T9SS type A sorting domain-containing protein [FCB group bacterium]|nr:T9SS type A sorting domain-containing protein [FCB group bacterium]